VLSRDQVLDDITLYWLTGTGASSARLYWESIELVSRWFTDPIEVTVTVPTGCTVFPREVPRPSRRLAEQRFTTSLTLASGADIAVVSKLLGHASISITADVYGHLVGTVASDAVNGAANLIAHTVHTPEGVSAG
jgi:hypothetical protein